MLPSPLFDVEFDSKGGSHSGEKETEKLSEKGVEMGSETRARIRGAVEIVRKDFVDSFGLDGDWDWEKERVRLFNSLGGGMRAAWARPVSGLPLVGGRAMGVPETWPRRIPATDSVSENGDEEEARMFVTEALANFALVVIEPLEVDWVELGCVPNRRTKFVRAGKEGKGRREWEWAEEEVVP